MQLHIYHVEYKEGSSWNYELASFFLTLAICSSLWWYRSCWPSLPLWHGNNSWLCVDQRKMLETNNFLAKTAGAYCDHINGEPKSLWEQMWVRNGLLNKSCAYKFQVKVRFFYAYVGLVWTQMETLHKKLIYFLPEVCFEKSLSWVYTISNCVWLWDKITDFADSNLDIKTGKDSPCQKKMLKKKQFKNW